ncbi:GGDEF domain-containing protein [Desulforhopalus sp. 52FAK]
MPYSQILSIHRIEQNPDNLLRLLVFTGIISMLLILSLTGLGIYRQSIADVVHTAEDDAKRIATVMVAEHEEALFSVRDRNVVLSKQEIVRINGNIRKFLHPFGIVKIKIFGLDRRVVFSNDISIIGRVNDANERLERALVGEVDSHLETKDTMVDLAEEQLFDVDVVETYLPFVNGDGKIVGSIELYLDVTRYREEIKQRVLHSVLILGTILLLVFLISYVLVYIGTRQLKKLLLQLQKIAVTDPLTGIYNRGALINRAEEEISRMKRSGGARSDNILGVIMIDLDHFKNVNDTYGHQVGDEVLRQMTRRVTNCLRAYDVFGRYGGEEFLVFIPDTDIESVNTAAERIRHELSKSNFICGDYNLSITASFGVTTCRDFTEPINVTLQRVDGALYKAKEEGRNRVVCFK